MSIEFLIGNINEQQALRFSHKYGFQNPDDFLLATRTISKYYKQCCTDSGDNDISEKLPHLSPELKPLVPLVLAARLDAVEQALGRSEYLKKEIKCVMSFSWDTRLILGDSSFRSNIRQVATINLHCQSSLKRENIYFEMDLESLCAMIEVLEKCVKRDKPLKQ